MSYFCEKCKVCFANESEADDHAKTCNSESASPSGSAAVSRIKYRDSFEEEIRFAVEKLWGVKTIRDMALKLGEEAGEVQGAIYKLQENRTDRLDVRKELGDLLIVASQIAADLGCTLEEARLDCWKEIQGRLLNSQLNQPSWPTTAKKP